jgi:hypothetical protein
LYPFIYPICSDSYYLLIETKEMMVSQAKFQD